MAERLNRRLIESARSMLVQAKLLPKLWVEAVNTATYLHVNNKSPTKAVDHVTPLKAGLEETRIDSNICRATLGKGCPEACQRD